MRVLEGMLERFVAWGEAQDDVRAIVLTSSHATTLAPVDALSDYDIILFLADMRARVDDRGWLDDFGPVLVAWGDPIAVEDGTERAAFVTQYENGLKIDFTLHPAEMLRAIAAGPELPEEFDAGYRVLLDKDRLAEGIKPPTFRAYIPTPPSAAEYLSAVEELFLDACYVAKFLWRDDMMAARQLLDRHMKQERLRPMLEWHFEIANGWSVKPGPYGRRMKMNLRPDLWAELEATYCGMGITENWKALFATIALMRRAAVEVGENLGYAYPHEQEKRVIAYLEKVKLLAHDADHFGEREQNG